MLRKGKQQLSMKKKMFENEAIGKDLIIRNICYFDSIKYPIEI